jgi:hypothetical protein
MKQCHFNVALKTPSSCKTKKLFSFSLKLFYRQTFKTYLIFRIRIVQTHGSYIIKKHQSQRWLIENTFFLDFHRYVTKQIFTRMDKIWKHNKKFKDGFFLKCRRCLLCFRDVFKIIWTCLVFKMCPTHYESSPPPPFSKCSIRATETCNKEVQIISR